MLAVVTQCGWRGHTTTGVADWFLLATLQGQCGHRGGPPPAVTGGAAIAVTVVTVSPAVTLVLPGVFLGHTATGAPDVTGVFVRHTCPAQQLPPACCCCSCIVLQTGSTCSVAAVAAVDLLLLLLPGRVMPAVAAASWLLYMALPTLLLLLLPCGTWRALVEGSWFIWGGGGRLCWWR